MQMSPFVASGRLLLMILAAILLAVLVLQEQATLLHSRDGSIENQAQRHPRVNDDTLVFSLKVLGNNTQYPKNRSVPKGAAATAAATTFSMPSSIGSCIHNTTSSFPYVGHDVFLDFAHMVFRPGSSLDLKGPSILFMHPQDAPAFASHVPKLQHRVVLISNSNIDECLPWAHGDNADSWRPHIDAILNSSMVVAWWGPNVVMAHPKLKNLPLGPKWNWRIAVHHSEDENKSRLLAVFSKWARDPAANFRLPKDNLLFVKLGEASSDNAVYPPSRRRRRVAVTAAQAILASEPPPRIKVLNASQRACVSASQAFAHVWRVEEYLFTMRQFKFVLSPVGNGVDTHRTWEALLAGSIPIVESSVRDSMYEGLPVLIVKSWSDLSLPLLQSAYTNFTAAGSSYRWEKLFAPYYLQQLSADLLQSYMSAGS